MNARPIAALLAGIALLLPGTAHADPTPTTDPGLQQTVAADEEVGADLTEVSLGHVDVGPKVVDGKFSVMARDDTATPPVWRRPGDLVLRVADTALMNVPAEEQFKFLGIPADQPVHVIPQTQNPQVVWLGWNTQDPSVVPLFGRGAELVIHGHTGPGDVHVFLSNGFDAPTPLYDSRKGGEQKIFMETNTHVHANWVFTEPGAHLVDVEIRTADDAPEQQAATGTLLFAVGDATRTADVVKVAESHGDTAPAATVSAEPSPVPGATEMASFAPSETPDETTPTATSSAVATAATSAAPDITPSQPTSPTAPAGESGGSMTGWIIGGVAVLAALGIGGLLAARRNSRLRDETLGDDR